MRTLPHAEILPLFETATVYDPETRSFAMYLDGELVGFARTDDEARDTLHELVCELIRTAYGPQAA